MHLIKVRYGRKRRKDYAAVRLKQKKKKVCEKELCVKLSVPDFEVMVDEKVKVFRKPPGSSAKKVSWCPGWVCDWSYGRACLLVWVKVMLDKKELA